MGLLLPAGLSGHTLAACPHFEALLGSVASTVHLSRIQPLFTLSRLHSWSPSFCLIRSDCLMSTGMILCVSPFGVQVGAKVLPMAARPWTAGSLRALASYSFSCWSPPCSSGILGTVLPQAFVFAVASAWNFFPLLGNGCVLPLGPFTYSEWSWPTFSFLHIIFIFIYYYYFYFYFF